MSEESYERMVGRLEGRYAGDITRTAVLAARAAKTTDPEERHDAAKQAVENLLFHELTWEKVEAVDISDIAYEAATKAVKRLV